MNDADLSRKYRVLRNKLNSICGELGELNNKLDNLNNALNDHFTINKKNPIKNALSDVRNQTNHVKYSIREDIIPMINRKL